MKSREIAFRLWVKLQVVEGQYRQLGDHNWWISSGRQAFEPSQFYQAIAAKDPLGGVATTTYDAMPC